ncbi:hypothetical protein ASD88_10225 [Pelomonas sp. Root662]|nr:hypothetical protein ASC81_10225 [Pelomonas sp. Root405]KRA72149.1 hypothetical protein ASD88_10225 [Pelomonas sp. Root662]
MIAGEISASTPVPGRLRFDDYELRLEARQLLRKGQEVTLGARAFDLLAALVQRQGRVVSKRELMTLVWPTTVVEEANLRVGMSGIRKELGPDLIATIPGRGYQFTAPVHTDLTAPSGQVPAPAAPSVGASATLPAFKHLIGRDALLDQLRTTLGITRLVTLTGHSGSGKTSLARELRTMEQAVAAAPDRSIHWVDLTASNDSDLLPLTIAHACGVPLLEQCSANALVAAMRSVRGLLILDNAEHLVDAVAAIAHALLEGCPHVSLLVTSQVRLKLDRETVIAVPPLDIAALGTECDEAQRWPAQALFLRHCQRAGRPLPIDQRTLDLIGDICSRVDGVPLAIEYAAAAVPLLGVQGVAAALEERRLALTSGRRDAPQRHRTLRTALAWSVSLLGPYEQQVFRRFGVFAGSCSMALLDPVINLEGEDSWRLMEAVSELIDRSLVVADDDHSPRYRLLESARAFAVEQLNQRGEMSDLRTRHAHGVERLFATTRQSAMVGELFMDAALSRLQAEVNNARTALQWALEHDAKVALSLVAGMAFVLRRTGGISEAGQCFAKTERMADQLPEFAVRSGWAREAIVHWTYSDSARATRWINIAEPLVRSAGEPLALVEMLALKANAIDVVQGDDVTLAAVLDEIQGMDLSRLPARLRILSAACILLGANRLGREQDVRWVERCISNCPPGDLHGRMSLAARLMGIYISSGRIDEAIGLGAPLYAELRGGLYQHALHWLPINLVQAHLLLHNHGPAAAIALECMRSSKANGLLYGWGDVLAFMACVAQMPDSAAGMHGFTDSVYEVTGGARGTVESHFRDASHQSVSQLLEGDEYSEAYALGQRWTDETMFELAVRVVAAFAATNGDAANSDYLTSNAVGAAQR